MTPYLDRRSVEDTLRTIASLAAGTVVAFDYFTADFLEHPPLLMRYSRAVLRAVGEPWTFGLDVTPPSRASVAAFLTSCGLSLDEYRSLGCDTGHTPAIGGFVTAIVGGRVSA